MTLFTHSPAIEPAQRDIGGLLGPLITTYRSSFARTFTRAWVSVSQWHVKKQKPTDRKNKQTVNAYDNPTKCLWQLNKGLSFLHIRQKGKRCVHAWLQFTMTRSPILFEVQRPEFSFATLQNLTLSGKWSFLLQQSMSVGEAYGYDVKKRQKRKRKERRILKA